MGESAQQRATERIIAATLRCVERWGVSKTTLDDVAREAGCGRATIYRTFQGGKRELLLAVVRHERRRLIATLDAAVAGADTLEDVLVAGSVAAKRFVADHAALQYLLAHEPDLVLPHVAFHRLDVVFVGAANFAEARLARFIPAHDVRPTAEWVTRVIATYIFTPSERLDIGNEADARRLVRTYLLPSIQPSQEFTNVQQ